MSVLNKAKEHFKNRLNNDPREIDVPEWDTKVYYKPLTLKQKIELAKYLDNPYEYAVRALIMRALDENLKPIFAMVNRTEIIREIDPEVVERIVFSMSEEEPDHEAIEKN